MEDNGCTQQAKKALERGNELYRNCRLSQAIKAYKVAATLAPSDRSPLSNLSAANFEVGKYAQCIHFSTKALELLKADDPDADIAKQKLLVRQAKAYLHLSLLDDVEKLLGQLDPSKETDSLRNSFQAAKDLNIPSPQRALLREAVLQLPRSRPYLQEKSVYLSPGHETAGPLYSYGLLMSASRDPVLSFMLCAVGDARHLFQTLVKYPLLLEVTQKLHITAVDDKPTIIARDLILFSLLQEAVTNQESRDMIQLSLSYLYSAHIIPPFAWEMLQATISKLLEKLENRQQPLGWVYLPVSLMDVVVRPLKDWQITRYTTSEIRCFVMLRPHQTIDHIHCIECEADHRTFKKFGVLFPPEARFEPELSALVTAYNNNERDAQQRISHYLDDHWKVNSTLTDWSDQMVRSDLGLKLNVMHDPFCIIDCLTKQATSMIKSSRSAYSVLTLATEFFERVCISLILLKERLTVEMIVGDMADVLERVRYGALDRPKKRQGEGDRVSPTTTDWPKKYHFIHMSNVPDYVGGSLTSFLYASPVLKEGPGMGLTSCIALNATQWRSAGQFYAEYLLMHDPVMIQKHFSFHIAQSGCASIAHFHIWDKHKRENIPLEQLMSQTTLSRWLIAHFLKICLPFRRPMDDKALVYAPLNMTMFMRLLVHMAEVGYPGHWLSDIIKSLGCGNINTAARPPRKYVLDPATVDEVHTLRAMCIMPWVAEFTTLVTQWRGLFPFATVVPSGMLPSLETIAEYSVKIPFVPAYYLDQPHFMLVFWNQRKYAEPPDDMYELLLDDGNGKTTASARKIRSDGINILSTFKWSVYDMTATFWLRSDVVDLMVEEDWSVYIWWTSTWNRYTPGQPLKKSLSKVRTWKKCVTPE
ncbi:hypothetical protein F4781DRAFT_423198 [Annulohypoxylon bovei var. microspora]|nr:hypothetical protein F4781DRAFT_423198 [Annulohypoxylon bovei var. microspora]